MIGSYHSMYPKHNCSGHITHIKQTHIDDGASISHASPLFHLSLLNGSIFPPFSFCRLRSLKNVFWFFFLFLIWNMHWSWSVCTSPIHHEHHSLSALVIIINTSVMFPSLRRWWPCVLSWCWAPSLPAFLPSPWSVTPPLCPPPPLLLSPPPLLVLLHRRTSTPPVRVGLEICSVFSILVFMADLSPSKGV